MIQTLEYADWSLGVHRRLSNRRVPISGSIEVTQRCNNQCVHCYNNLSAGDRTARNRELSLDEYRRIIDEITAAGCLWLLLTGGEPFVRPDFLEIYGYAKHKGLLITLFTNGTLITPAVADYLARFAPFAIEITLYGRSRQTYESITRIPGSYDRCLNGIQLLMDRKLPLKLKTVAITRNRHEIEDMKHFVENELGLEFKFDAMINPRRDCSQSPLEVRLTPAEVVALDLEDSRRVAEWKRFARQFNKPLLPMQRADNLYLCGGASNSFAIDPYGWLTPCIFSSDGAYDLRRGSFRQGWEEHLFSVRQKKITRQSKCTSCQLKPMCGMCPANGELECADAEAPVDFLCQVAHLRAYTMDLEIAAHGPCDYCPGGRHYEEMMRIVEGLRQYDAAETHFKDRRTTVQAAASGDF